jgi:hypothetical protein
LIKRLWVHEAIRTYIDPVKDDRLKTKLIEVIFEHVRGLSDVKTRVNQNIIMVHMFSDQMEYKQVKGLKDTVDVLKRVIHRNPSTLHPSTSNLLFQEGVEHLFRICRILHLSGGHVICQGHEGLGKRKLCRLAAYLARCEVVLLDKTSHQVRLHVSLFLYDEGNHGLSFSFLANIGFSDHS